MKPKLVAVLAGLLGLGFVYSGAGLFVCIGIALYALRGVREAVEALFLLAFLIITLKLNISLGRWIILLAASSRIFWEGVVRKGEMPTVFGPLLAFSVPVAGTSIVVSAFPLVSLLKILTFTLGATAVLVGMYQTRHAMQYWLSWLYTMGGVILVMSIPFYFLPAGFSRNGVLFRGITNDPQTFGAVVAPLTALFTGLYLFYPNLKNRRVGILAALGWIGIYLTFSRTSMFAAVLGLVGAVAVGCAVRGGEWGHQIGNALRRPIVIGAGILVLGLSALQIGPIQSYVTQFIFKDDRAKTVVRVFEKSRGGLVDRSMANFLESPIVGIGFGAPSYPARFTHHLKRGPFGIPVSATVEKGFMPTAVLEETGILGAILILILVGFLIAPVMWYGNIVAFWVLLTALLVNFGEMIFFTMGGNGLYLWIVMSFCYYWAVARTTKHPRSEARLHRLAK